MNAPDKCLCKELSTPQTAPGSRWVPTGTPGGFRLEGGILGNYVSLSWTPSGPLRMDPVAQQAKEMREQLNAQREQMAAVALHEIATCPAKPLSIQEPIVKDRVKWQMNYFWKKACAAEGVSFTRKEHCAYPRVLATYHRLRKEYDEFDEKLVKQRSAGW